jgi:hypothetical protein
MRLIQSLCAIAAFIALSSAQVFRPGALRADEPADGLTANSVWQGNMEQSNPKSSYPVILFVKQRNGNAFEGTTWYPTLGNGLLKVTGQIAANGTVTFTEDKVIHGDTFEGNFVVIAGSKYTAELRKTTIVGTGELTLPNSNEVAKLTFTLKRAE